MGRKGRERDERKKGKWGNEIWAQTEKEVTQVPRIQCTYRIKIPTELFHCLSEAEFQDGHWLLHTCL